MAHYAALISLKQTIQRHLDSSQILILPPSREILEFSSKEVVSLVEVLQTNEEILISNSSNERVISLNGQVRDAAYKLEDAIESHVSKQSESLVDDGFSEDLFLDLGEVKEEISSFIETVKKTEKMLMEELSKPLPEEEDDIPSKTDFSGKNSKMVGFSVELSVLKKQLMCGGIDLIPIVGMAGIGKTALAMEIYEDPSISSYYDLRMFVTLGPKCRVRKAMLSILDQLNHDINEVRMAEHHNLAERIYKHLKGRSFLVVLDDVWNKKDLKNLVRSLPLYGNNRCRVLVTTRLEKVAHAANSCFVQYIRFLNKEESWDLLCEKVFGEGNLCPIQLEKFGKKIVENCEGLPLAIITVADILSKREKTLEYWEKAAKKENSIFTDAYDQMWGVLIRATIAYLNI